MMPKAISHALIRHPDEPRVLTVHGRLPVAEFDNELWFSDVVEVCQAHGRVLDVSLWGLRQVMFLNDDDPQTSVFELMLTDDDRDIDLATIDGSDALAWMPVSRAEAPAQLEACLIRYGRLLESGEVPDLRAAWARPEFPAQMREWVAAEVEQLGLAVQGLEQVKHWGISTVWRIKTDSADIYFKGTGSTELFVSEGEVSTALSRFFPDRVPRPLAHDAGRNWMLLPDFGDIGREGAGLETRREILTVHHEIQRQSMGLVDDLLAAGCIDRRFDVMRRQIPGLLDDEPAVGGLTGDEREELTKRIPQLMQLIDRLETAGPPPALVHGDLGAHNTARSGGQLIVFDWTDACVAHPFFDYLMVCLVQDEETEAALRALVAELWSDYVAEDQFDDVFGISKILFRVFLAISYQYIGHSLEDDSKPELDLTAQILRDVLADLRARD